MENDNRINLSNIWEMRNLTVKDFFEKLSKNPEMKFLITTAGIWWLTRMLVAVTIGANVIYYVFRIFNLVLG
jgi:hypothetical protein